MCIITSAILPRKRTYGYGTTITTSSSWSFSASSSVTDSPSTGSATEISAASSSRASSPAFRRSSSSARMVNISFSTGRSWMRTHSAQPACHARAFSGMRPASSMEMTSTSGRGPFFS